MTDELLTTKDVAERLKVSTEAVRQMYYRGSIPAPLKIGRRAYWRENDFEAWIARRADAAVNGIGRSPS